MEPLSCRNCCHNPLQLGIVGTAFGFCTRHQVVLSATHLTTCGQLLRKDLRAEGAVRERTLQARTFRTDGVSLLADPSRDALEEGLAEANGKPLPDPVIEEVMGYGLLDSKIATMAALHRIPGTRAEIAMLSLGRGYFQNCIERTRSWTSGVHLLQWTLARLVEEPLLGASDLFGTMSGSIERTNDLAKWDVLFFRLIFVADIATQAKQDNDPLGHVLEHLDAVIEHTRPGSPESLVKGLRKREEKLRDAFPTTRYEELRRALRKEDDAA